MKSYGDACARTPLRQRLNAALAAILADGTYAKINAKYFPFRIY